jgi:hypothetical protein
VDTQQFIASLVSSLAWPGAIIVLALLFRRQLRQLLSGPLKRLKAGPSGLELEFDRLISEAQAQVEPAPDVAELEAPESAVADLAEVARASPAAAVLDGFARVEQELRERLRAAGDPRADNKRGALMLARAALDAKLITPETMEAIRGMAVLRNLAAHGGAADLSEDRAREYLALADAVLFAIGRGAR